MRRILATLAVFVLLLSITTAQYPPAPPKLGGDLDSDGVITDIEFEISEWLWEQGYMSDELFIEIIFQYIYQTRPQSILPLP